MLYLYPQFCSCWNEIFSGRADNEISDYLLFKEEVKTHFGLTAEQSRKAFREITRKLSETYSQVDCYQDKALN